MQKILTIVIPSYNTENYIDECLPTFLSNEILNKIEILIVNDGSKDNTLKIAKKYEATYPNTIKVIDKENGGHGSTINYGIKYASGRYFKVIDGDDWVDSDQLCLFVDYISKLDDIDLILNPFTIINEKTKDTTKFEYSDLQYNEIYDADFIYSLSKNIQMHSITYRTDILKDNEIKLDEKMFYVDQEYNLFPIPFIKSVIYLPYNVYQYRTFSQNQSMNFNNLQKNRNMHKNVLLNLNLYYTKNKDSISDAKREYFKRCISDMAFLQILIYLSIKYNKTVKLEFYNFLKQIEEIELSWNRASYIIKQFKKFNFKFYRLFNLYIRLRMKKYL